MSMTDEPQNQPQKSEPWESEHIQALILALKNESPRARFWVAYALEQIKDVKAIDSLVNALKDTELEMRFYVIEALGQIGDKEVIPELKRLAQVDNCETWKGRNLSTVAVDAIKKIMGSQKVKTHHPKRFPF